ncbi:hypothetical protein TrRE_jg9623, partial [Triparma retinervis]
PFWLDDDDDNSSVENDPFAFLAPSQSQSPYKTPQKSQSPRKSQQETCTNCGGTDFYFSEGMGYCSECQAMSQNMSQVEMDEGDVINLANRGAGGNVIRSIKKRPRVERQHQGRNWLIEIRTTIEATRDVLKEVLVHWDVNPELMLVELRPVVVAVGEFWGSMGEDKFLKMASDNPSARRTDGGGQYRARPGSPDVGHGLTFGILHYANVTFQMGYSVEDVVRGVER